MAKGAVALLAFNRGLVSKYGLSRVDIKRTAFSAETHVNWVPRVLGSMMLRPGLQYLLSTASNAQSKSIPFVFSSTDYAQLECTNLLLRPLISNAPITRASVSTAVTNGNFDANITSWTSADETAAASAWVTGGYMGLLGTGYNAAIRRQTLSVAGGDVNVEHALRIIIARGPVVFRAGSTDGGQNFIHETTLGTGTHSLAFTPSGDVHLQFSNTLLRQVLVDSVQIEAVGTMTLPTPWTTSDLLNLRWTQSADVVYVACENFQQRKVERRATRSWSIVLYEPEDGPFKIQNLTTTTITPSAPNGNITLTASRSLFNSTHVGAIFRLRSTGQFVSQTLAGPDQFTESVRVAGVGDGQRSFVVNVTGTHTGTLVLQASYDQGLTWIKAGATTLTDPGNTTVADKQDNAIILYRVGFVGAAYTSGSAAVTITYAGGGATGIARITAFSSETSVSAVVLSHLGGTNATSDWSEGTWSADAGFPTAVVLDQGRLWWTGKRRNVGSVSDAYESFDDTIEGDAGPIQRSIGHGPIDKINWLLSLDQLIMGTPSAEIAIRASALGELVTANNYNLKDASDEGSANVAAVKLNGIGFFVHKSTVALYQTEADPSRLAGYTSSDAGILVPDLLLPTIVSLIVQRKPDKRIHCILADGTVAMLIFDKLEEVAAWILIETDGVVEDAVVLPGVTEDTVIYTVKRTINSSTVRYHEKWALESECRGSTLNKQADSFLTYSGAPTTTLTAAHLAGEDLIVWADGQDFSPDVDGVQTTYTADGSGVIALPSAVSNAVFGLAYNADWESSKLAYFSQTGSALTQKKRIVQLGLIMVDSHARALKYGQDFDHLDDMPQVEDGAVVDANYIWDQYDRPSIPLNGKWDTDSRLCLRATAPRPVAISAAVIALSETDKP